jgi:hypothetical protein
MGTGPIHAYQAVPGCEIRMMKPTDSLQVLFERLSRCVGQHHSPILLSFPPPRGDLPPLEIEILHPQLKYRVELASFIEQLGMIGRFSPLAHP